MKTRPIIRLAALILTLGAAPAAVFAHCDTLDGPVVQTARAALGKGDVTPVLKWIKADDETAIRTAFAETLAVRKLSPAAAEFADRYFFETLVRVHRAGEGEPYTGLQPAGSAEPALAAADHAIEQGSADTLVNELAARLQERLRAGFKELLARKAHMDESVAAGRAYTEAYVEFIHLYEQLAAEAEAHGTKHGVHVH